MLTGNRPILVVAQSGRMFAQSAAKAGFHAYVVDMYGDRDTRRYAEGLCRVTDFKPDTLANACHQLTRALADMPLVYGSGVDHHPELIAELGKNYDVLGNTPGVLALIGDPQAFFALLNTLDIPHPQTRFSAPEDTAGWLKKTPGSEGGKAVVFANDADERAPDTAYFQRLAPGTPCSLLFLADGRAMVPVGFNSLCTARSSKRPFLFAGAINRAELDSVQRLQAERAAARLTVSLGLRGFNSLDFMAADDTIQVLEINSRPSATVQLYDDVFPDGWLAAHCDACRGFVIAPLPSTGIRGFRTVFAKRETTVPSNFDWPAHCSDIPDEGSRIESGQPICTVHASGENIDATQQNLTTKENEMMALLCA